MCWIVSLHQRFLFLVIDVYTTSQTYLMEIEHSYTVTLFAILFQVRKENEWCEEK